MAIVTRFFPVTKDRVGRAKTTECGFCPVDSRARNTYLSSLTEPLTARSPERLTRACISIVIARLN